MARTRKQLVAVLALLTAAITLTGCGDKGPTAAEAGQQLKTDISALLRHINARNVQVTDDGTRDHDCGKGKAKRTYAVTGTKYTPGDTAAGLLSHMVGASVTGYKLVNVGEGGTTAVMRNKSAHTGLTLEAYARSVLKVSGSTDCLRIR